MRKIKFYNKDIHKTEQTIKEVAIVIIAFFLGFIVGMFAISVQFKIQNKYTKILEQKQLEQKEVSLKILEEMEE